jgi:hypothetical protein
MRRPVVRNNRGERGNSMVEFAIVIWLWSLLLLGTVAIGLTLTSILQVVQTSRDLAHMYAAGVDFTSLADTNLLTGGGGSASLVQGMVLTGGGQNAMVVFSQVRHVYSADSDCNACPNADKDVFLNQVVFGNTGLYPSVLGSPDSADLNSKGNTKNYLTHTADVTSQFQLFSSLMASKDVAYVVEVYMAGSSVPFAGLAGMGLTTTGNYSRAVF